MTMAKRLDGQTAWISGAASGIGEATAELFAEEGASVAVVDTQAERGQAVAERIRTNGGKVVFLECNVSREDDVRLAIETTVKEFGGLQIIVNCAGLVHVTPLHECSETAWDELMAVNLKSIFFSLKHSYTYIVRNRRSYMVNIASISSFVGQASTPAYTTSKHAVIGLSRSIALDYAKDGLRCNSICPGITDTPMLRYHLSKTSDPETALTNRLHRVPMGVALTPKDIAKAALYFSCEDSSGITGTSLVIDGGYTTTAEWENTSPTKFMER